MKNLIFEITEDFDIINVRWKEKFIRKIFKKNFASKNHAWEKVSFPMTPMLDLFANNSVQLMLNFHIPKSPSLQQILIELQSVIYPTSEEELNLRRNAVRATLKMIGEQSQTLILKKKCMSFFGHKENFRHVNRFTILGCDQWPFEFQRAKVRWDAYTEDSEADIILTIDFFMNLSKIETATWIENGDIRIPIEDVELHFNFNEVLNREQYPDLAVLNNSDILEVSSTSFTEDQI